MTISAVNPLKIPGIGTQKDIIERSDVTFGRWEQQTLQGQIVDGTARDAGNDVTTKLRAGLVLGLVTATGQLKEFSASATDGTQIPFAILLHDLDTQSEGANTDTFTDVLVAGLVKEASVIPPGAGSPGLSGNAVEHAIRSMFQPRIIFDDVLNNVPTAWRGPEPKTANYTVLESDNGTMFTTEGTAGNVDFTLPATAERHLRYLFFNAEDFNMKVIAGTVDTLIVFNDVAADSVSFETAGEKVGGAFEVFGDGAKWIVMPRLGQDTQTVTVTT